MKPGENVYIGDGAYLEWTGYSFLFKANSHEHPTDVVSIEDRDVPKLLHYLCSVLTEGAKRNLRLADTPDEGEEE